MNKSQFSKIPRATITKVLAESQIQCGVCLDTFNLKETGVRKLPCSHLYHAKCIFPWLKRNASCPYCRAKLPNIKRDSWSDLQELIREVRDQQSALRIQLNWLQNQVDMLIQQRRQPPLRSQFSSTLNSAHDNHSQIEQPSVEQRQQQTLEDGIRVRRAAAVRARSAIADIYRR